MITLWIASKTFFNYCKKKKKTQNNRTEKFLGWKNGEKKLKKLRLLRWKKTSTKVQREKKWTVSETLTNEFGTWSLERSWICQSENLTEEEVAASSDFETARTKLLSRNQNICGDCSFWSRDTYRALGLVFLPDVETIGLVFSKCKKHSFYIIYEYS